MAMKTTVVVERFPTVSETFVARHARHFHAAVVCQEEDHTLSAHDSSADLRVFSPTKRPEQSLLAGLPGWFRLAPAVPRCDVTAAEFHMESKRGAVLEGLLDEERPDVILAEFAPNALSALPACRTRGIPVVAHFHGYDASTLMSASSYPRVVREVFRDSPAVICVSSFMKKR